MDTYATFLKDGTYAEYLDIAQFFESKGSVGDGDAPYCRKKFVHCFLRIRCSYLWWEGTFFGNRSPGKAGTYYCECGQYERALQLLINAGEDYILQAIEVTRPLFFRCLCLWSPHWSPFQWIPSNPGGWQSQRTSIDRSPDRVSLWRVGSCPKGCKLCPEVVSSIGQPLTSHPHGLFYRKPWAGSWKLQNVSWPAAGGLHECEEVQRDHSIGSAP